MNKATTMVRITILFCLAFMAGALATVAQVKMPTTTGKPVQMPMKALTVPRFVGKGRASASGGLITLSAKVKKGSARKSPPPLTQEQKSQVFESKMGAMYAMLTPARMTVGDKARLMAFTPAVVNDTGAPGTPAYITFFSAQEAMVGPDTLFFPMLGLDVFSPSAGGFFLIDCSVTPGIYKIGETGSSDRQTITVPEGGHLLFHLDQADKGWHTFSIQSDASWQFFSAEITLLN